MSTVRCPGKSPSSAASESLGRSRDRRVGDPGDDGALLRVLARCQVHGRRRRVLTRPFLEDDVRMVRHVGVAAVDLDAEEFVATSEEERVRHRVCSSRLEVALADGLPDDGVEVVARDAGFDAADCVPATPLTMDETMSSASMGERLRTRCANLRWEM